MEEVLALYEKPLSEKEPVVCIDEKPVVLHADIRAPRAMRSGRIARRDCEYERRGTANAFCGVEPKAGRHFTKVTPNRSSPEFADYLVEIVAAYTEAETNHLVMDNLSSHRRKALAERYGEKIGGLLWELHSDISVPWFMRTCRAALFWPTPLMATMAAFVKDLCLWSFPMQSASSLRPRCGLRVRLRCHLSRRGKWAVRPGCCAGMDSISRSRQNNSPCA